jgi:molybdate transport system regulatory protein
MQKQSRSAALRVRIDLTPGVSLGPGKVALLEHIAASGSLSQAARDLGMSYRRAWMLLDDLNRAFVDPVTTSSIGGSGGGGARLTPFGESLVEAYRTVEREAGAAAAKSMTWLARSTKSVKGDATERRPLNRPLERSQAPAATKKEARNKRGRATTRP